MDDNSRLIYETFAGPFHIVIMERDTQRSLLFHDPFSGRLSGPMSRIDLVRPLHLLAEYTQAALLVLLWRPTPRRLALLGFGGGRIAMVLQHHMPGLEIMGVDIHPIFYELAQEYFALPASPKMHYVVGDARQALADDQGLFDCIIMDAFSNEQDHLNHLATAEFYQLVRRHMQQAGVMCVNLLRADPLYTEKAYTFTRSFRHVAVLGLKHSLMLFGSNGWTCNQPEAVQRAAQLQNRHGFDVPLESHAAELQRLRDSELPALFQRLRPGIMRDPF